MAIFNFVNVHKDFNMLDFKSVSEKFGGLAKSCKFAVRIVPSSSYLAQYSDIMKDLIYLCEAAEYPGRGLNTMDVRYYGTNFKVPFQTSYEDMTLTFLCRAESPERKFFDDWMNLINPTTTYDFSYRDQYSCEIQIFQYGDDNAVNYQFSLLDAFPVLVNPQQLTWADDQFLRLGITFTYNKWVRPRMDDSTNKLASGGPINVPDIVTYYNKYV
jgi:hypothetical protein